MCKVIVSLSVGGTCFGKNMYGIPGDAVKHGIWNNRITGNENCWHCTWNCHPASTDNYITFKLGLEMAFFFLTGLHLHSVLYAYNLFFKCFSSFLQNVSATRECMSRLRKSNFVNVVYHSGYWLSKWRSKSSIFQTESTSHPLSHVHITVQFCTVVVSFPDSSLRVEGGLGTRLVL